MQLERCPAPRPSKSGTSAAGRRQAVRIDAPPRPDRGELLGDVDPDRAPGDAAAAADAARAAELVVPGAELVRQPLPVARAAARPDAAAVDVGVVDREAAVPDARALGVAAAEVGGVLDARAEAGRADERAVAAGEAALGDLVPARMLEVAGEQVAEVAGVELRPICAAAARATAAARRRDRRRSRRRRGSSASTSAPRSLPASTSRRCSPSRISVSARS